MNLRLYISINRPIYSRTHRMQNDLIGLLEIANEMFTSFELGLEIGLVRNVDIVVSFRKAAWKLLHYFILFVVASQNRRRRISFRRRC